jgi:hypothetical protein
VLRRVGDETVLDEHLRPRRLDNAEAVVELHVVGVIVRPAARVAGKLFDLIRD